MDYPFILDYNYITTKILKDRKGGLNGLYFLFTLDERKLLRLKRGALLRVTLKDYVTDYVIVIDKRITSLGRNTYSIYFTVNEVIEHHLEKKPYKIMIHYLGQAKPKI